MVQFPGKLNVICLSTHISPLLPWHGRCVLTHAIVFGALLTFFPVILSIAELTILGCLIAKFGSRSDEAPSAASEDWKMVFLQIV